MASTITPQQQRGPLSHIVDALRLDNRELLLETLRHDPTRIIIGDGDNNLQPLQGSADSAAGSDGAPPPSTNNNPTVVVEQQLIFGSSNLRRVMLRQVMHNNIRSSNDNNSKKKKGKKKNVVCDVEEEEIINDWNVEMMNSTSNNGSSSGGHVTKIVGGAQVLSPSCDGSILSSSNNNNLNPSRSNNNMFSNNPFEDDNPMNDVGGSSSSNNDAQIITYILRGGGFDMPSLAAAALHRRNIIKSTGNNTSSSSRGFHHPSESQQQQRQTSEKVFRFVFVPRMTEMERAFLGELGVVESSSSSSSDNSGIATHIMNMGSINTLESLPIDLIPLDDDVLSLELSGGGSSLSCGSTTFSESDNSSGGGKKNTTSTSQSSSSAAACCMRHASIEGCEADVADIVAKSLLKLQLLNRGGSGDDESSLKGAIKRVQGLGPLATAVIDRMMILRIEEEMLEAQQAEENENNNEDEFNNNSESYEDMDRDEVVNASYGVEITAHSKGVTSSSGHPMNDNTDTNAMSTTSAPSIQALLVIDRRIDLVTPMLTPLTYEGLIDDVLQIQVGACVAVKKSIVEPDDNDVGTISEQQQEVILPLNDSDPLYAEVRDKHVETFGSFLQNQAKALKESHSQFTNRETARDLTEIHQFVKQIPVFTRNLRSLTNHIHIAELVKSAAEATSFRQRWQTERSMLESEPCYETLEDLIASGEPPYRWLRLFCLQSLTSNGIKATRYDSLRREVVQTYGYEFLMVLNDLEKAGFLRKRETFFMDSMATPYSTLRKALDLINADVDPSNPEDASYVTSGYAPMTVRWIQAAMKGYAGLDEAMKELPVGSGGGGGGGRWVDIEQQCPPESLVSALKRKRGPSLGALAKKWSDKSDGGKSDDKPVLLVYYVGGVTFSELAALRFLSRRPSFPYNIVCCTTEIVNGSTLLRSLSC